MTHDIFISYSRRDLAAVKLIKEELERLGFSCWMDLEGIESGSCRFSRHIIAAIDESKCMLFFLSSESQSSDWALKEIDYATAEKKHVVLVRFNDDPMTKEFRFDFGRSDVIDWRIPEQKAKLLRDLKNWSSPAARRGGIDRESAKAETGKAASTRNARGETASAQDRGLPVHGPRARIVRGDAAPAVSPSIKPEAKNPSGEKRRRQITNTPHFAGEILRMRVRGVDFNLRWIPENETEPAFWMGETQVTQLLWMTIMGKGNNPSRFCRSFSASAKRALGTLDFYLSPLLGLGRQLISERDADSRPVECVSWNDCQAFLTKLNLKNEVRATGLVFRLPTETEWEHACHAGGSGKYCRLADGTEITAKTLERVAWFTDNSKGVTHPVAKKEPNAWGLFDMNGNVCEWTQSQTNGQHVLRAGSWDSSSRNCMASRRLLRWPDDRGKGGLGFRLCATPPQ